MVIANHISFRVLFDKIASVYFIRKKYICIFALETATPGNQHCASCIDTLSFPISNKVESSILLKQPSSDARRPVPFQGPLSGARAQHLGCFFRDLSGNRLSSVPSYDVAPS